MNETISRNEIIMNEVKPNVNENKYGKKEIMLANLLGNAPVIASQAMLGPPLYRQLKSAYQRIKNKASLNFGKSPAITRNLEKATTSRLISKLQKAMGTKTNVYLDTKTALKSGFGAYVPEKQFIKSDVKPGVHLPAEKITGKEIGVLSHEFGHAKNFALLNKLKLTYPYMASRMASGPAGLITSGIAAGAKEDKNARKAAIIGSIISAPTLVEEGIATTRGIRGLSKMYGGFGKAFTKGGAGKMLLLNSSYLPVAAAPALTYMARKIIKARKEKKHEQDNKTNS